KKPGQDRGQPTVVYGHGRGRPLPERLAARFPAAAQAQPHGRVSPIVRSAQQALPTDPSKQGVVQPAA
ncbi:MAG TPA: hypothetical protein VKG61_12800, partial [Streptosporangiaceae bacterium]|nr:hypothetical protein [Streptosporangiaceae bacterium]